MGRKVHLVKIYTPNLATLSCQVYKLKISYQFKILTWLKDADGVIKLHMLLKVKFSFMPTHDLQMTIFTAYKEKLSQVISSLCHLPVPRLIHRRQCLTPLRHQ